MPAALLGDLRRWAIGTAPVAATVPRGRAWWKAPLTIGTPVVALLIAVGVWMTMRQPALAFARVLEIDASESPAHYELGVVARLMKDDATANREFGRFRDATGTRLRAEPKNAGHYLELAVVSQRMGQTQQANALARKAMAMDPDQHFGLATLLSVQGKKYEAIDQLELAIQKGFRNYVWLMIHTDLDNLRTEPRFLALMDRYLKR